MKEDQLKKALKDKKRKEGKSKHAEEEDEWEDVDEHEAEVFDKEGFFGVPEQQLISAEDENLLKKMNKVGIGKATKKNEEEEEEEEEKGRGGTLADLIMRKLETGDYQVAGKPIDKAGFLKKGEYEELEEEIVKKTEPKVVATFTSIGQFLQTYKSGKMPKALNLLPKL